MSTDENDIVFDPFMGISTTAVVAKRLGRNYIGFELDKNYAEITRNKLQTIYPVPQINDCWVSFYLDDVITLRDKDWERVKEFYSIPQNPKDIDHIPIIPKYQVSIPKTTKSIENEKDNLFSIVRKRF